MRRVRAVLVGALCSGAFAGAASAGEVRVGAGPSGHDLVVQVDDEGQEQGASLVADYVFDSPAALRAIGSPRPYVGTSVSLSGYTSFVDAGLLYRAEGRRLYGEFAFGLAAHDGELDANPANPDQIAFGSRVLLHFGLAAGYRFDERWAVELSTQHWSHGGVFDDSNNDGADVLAIRVARRLGR
jgi:lipid A 3-O-deacylase